MIGHECPAGLVGTGPEGVCGFADCPGSALTYVQGAPARYSTGTQHVYACTAICVHSVCISVSRTVWGSHTHICVGPVVTTARCWSRNREGLASARLVSRPSARPTLRPLIPVSVDVQCWHVFLPPPRAWM